jgi:protein gp37
MAKNSNIEWTDATWNPWMGCTKVSPGCRNCYMFRDQKRFGHDPTVIRRSKTTFRNPLRWKEPRMIFVCSWSDFFHEDVPLTWLDEAWDIMRRTPHHTYLLLTKRASVIRHSLPEDWENGYPNVWIGVSVESNEQDWRLVALEEISATVKFVSAEPLLGPFETLYSFTPSIDWVIVGGESGPDYRQMNLDWARSIRDQCQKAEVPFFFKQIGGSKKINGAWGGRLLDGREWNEVPT